MRMKTMHSRCALLATTIAAGLLAISALAEEPSRVVTVTTCDLVDRPLQYANHRVRVRGRILGGPGSSPLVGDGCPSGQTPSFWVELPEDDDIVKYEPGWSIQRYAKAVKSGELREDGPDRAWTLPLPLETPRSCELKAARIAVERSDRRGIEVVVTGRFDVVGTSHGDSIL